MWGTIEKYPSSVAQIEMSYTMITLLFSGKLNI